MECFHEIRDGTERETLFRDSYVSARVVIVIFALILIVFWFFIGWDNARHSAFHQRGRGRFQGSFLFDYYYKS